MIFGKFLRDKLSKFKKMPTDVAKTHMRSNGAANKKRCLLNCSLRSCFCGISTSKQNIAITAASDRLWDIETGGSVMVTM